MNWLMLALPIQNNHFEFILLHILGTFSCFKFIFLKIFLNNQNDTYSYKNYIKNITDLLFVFFLYTNNF